MTAPNYKNFWRNAVSILEWIYKYLFQGSDRLKTPYILQYDITQLLLDANPPKQMSPTKSNHDFLCSTNCQFVCSSYPPIHRPIHPPIHHHLPPTFQCTAHERPLDNFHTSGFFLPTLEPRWWKRGKERWASKGVQVGSNGSKLEMPLFDRHKSAHDAPAGGPKKHPAINYESL